MNVSELRPGDIYFRNADPAKSYLVIYSAAEPESRGLYRVLDVSLKYGYVSYGIHPKDASVTVLSR